MKKFLRLSKIQKIGIAIVTSLYFLFILIGFKMQLSNALIDIKFTQVSCLYILKNNGFALIKLILLGIITMCIYDIFAIFMNGMNLGIGLASIYQHKMFSAFFTGLLPHAIFEVPAIILSTTVPLIFFIILIRSLNNKNVKKKCIFIKNLKNECLNLIVLAFLFVIIAAIIEGLISKF